MRRQNKRLAALLIALCMIIALIPLSTVSVLADQSLGDRIGALFTNDTTTDTDASDETQPSESEEPSGSPEPSESPDESESPAPSPSETVAPSPSEEPSKLPFTDVSAKDYFYEPVEWAVGKTITAGTTETTFSPNVSCSRAQVMVFLWRANGSPTIIMRSNPFKDVKTTDYYYDAVRWAVSRGITSGTSSETFSPNDACSRAQVMTFLWRAKNTPSVGRRNLKFEDVPSDAYYYDPVCWAVNNTITAGTSPTRFSPDKSCTRAEVMTFLWQAYK